MSCLYNKNQMKLKWNHCMETCFWNRVQQNMILHIAVSLHRTQATLWTHFAHFMPIWYFMMTSLNGNIFRVTGPLCGEFTGRRWIPFIKASNVQLWCFLWSAPWINGWVNNLQAGHLRHHGTHYDVIVMCMIFGRNNHASALFYMGNHSDMEEPLTYRSRKIKKQRVVCTCMIKGSFPINYFREKMQEFISHHNPHDQGWF